jgi:hypothetical protein
MFADRIFESLRSACAICTLFMIAMGPMISFAYPQSNEQAVQQASYKSVPKNKDFQIRVDIYTDDTKPPVNSLQTIFSNGMAIEFNDQQGRFTVVDSGKGRVTILDKEKKTLVHMDMRTVESQLDRAIQMMTPEQQTAYSCDGPPVQESRNTFSLGNRNIRYHFAPMSTQQEIASGYAEFSDWVTRVYALHGPKMPPQIRLELNKLLVDQSQLPAELRRVIYYSGKSESPIREEIIARMNVTEALTENDKSRVASVYQWMQEFKPTTEASFFK